MCLSEGLAQPIAKARVQGPVLAILHTLLWRMCSYADFSDTASCKSLSAVDEGCCTVAEPEAKASISWWQHSGYNVRLTWLVAIEVLCFLLFS